MLGPHELIVERRSDLRRILQYLRKLRSEVQLVARRKHGRALGSFERIENGIGERYHIHAEALKHTEDHTFFLQDNCGQEVQRIDMVLTALDRKLMRTTHGLLCLWGEILERYHSMFVYRETMRFSMFYIIA